MEQSQGGQAVSIEELKRENEILKDALCMEQDRLSHARHHIQNAQDRIKRLEEALSEIELIMKQPASNHRLMQIAGPARQVINIIKKAKEAKP